MALVLTAPTGPLTTFEDGTVMLRAADYVAPSSRASLSVVDDSANGSVCGDVVLDEQQLAYYVPGSPTGYEYVRWQDADDTITIPFADLGLTYGTYEIFYGVRLVGAGSAGHHFNADIWTPSTSDVAIWWGFDGTAVADNSYSFELFEPETQPHYKIVGANRLTTAAAGTDFQVRCFSGEDSTYAVYLDCVYFIPFDYSPDWYLADPTGWDPVYGNYPFTPLDDAYDDAGTTAFSTGQYSVMFAEQTHFGTRYSGVGADYQEGADEISFYGVTSFDDHSKSRMTIIAGSHHTPAFTIVDEPFDQSAGGWNGLPIPSSDGRLRWYGNEWEIPFTFTGSSLSMDVFAPGDNVNDLQYGCNFHLGSQFWGGIGSGENQYTDWTPLLYTTDFIISAEFVIDGSVESPGEILIGGWDDRFLVNNKMAFFGLRVTEDAGVLTADLRAFQHGSNNSYWDQQSETTFCDPVEVNASYDFSTPVHVKVERRHYYWRAKVWMDGDAEPGSWTVEGFAPAIYRDGSFNYVLWDDYPWTSNSTFGRWQRGAQTLHPMIGFYARTHTFSSGGFLSGRVHRTLTWDNVLVEYDPVGDPDDVHFKMEKSDGTTQYGSVTIPFGSWRVIVATKAQYVFDTGNEGVNVWLWKEAGAAELQAAVWSDMFEHYIPPVTFRPHIYRLVFN